MKVKRVVSNIEASNIDKADSFYKDIFGLEILMNHGWIRTYGSDEQMTIQISVASEGGSVIAVPELSIEVDDLETALDRVQKLKYVIEYGPENEP